MRRAVQPTRVVRQAEQPHAAVLATERLQPVEDRLAIVQHAGGRIQGERPVRHNARIMPALTLMEVHQEHVVGEDAAEGERLIRRMLLRAGSLGDGNLGQGALSGVG